MATASSEPDYDGHADCVLGKGAGVRESACDVCILDFKADDATVTHNRCQHTVHKDCFDEWSRVKQDRGETVTCPYCRAELLVVMTEEVHWNDSEGLETDPSDIAEHEMDPSDSDTSSISNHYSSWEDDAPTDNPFQDHIHLSQIPKLTDMRTYVDPRIQARRAATDGCVYEIPPDMYHRAIVQQLPRRRNMPATPMGLPGDLCVIDLYMDDQSYGRFARQISDWQVEKYQVYWAPPAADGVDFFLVPIYPAYHAGEPRLREVTRELVGLPPEDEEW